MANYIYFLPNSKNLSATTSSQSMMLYYATVSGVTMAPISAETNCDWVNIRQIDETYKSIQIEIANNTEGVERTAVISIVTKVQEEGNAFLTTDYDITTLRQAAPNQSGGSIIPNYSSFTPKAAGDNGTVIFSTSNVIKSSIGISCDQPYVSLTYLTDSNGYKHGFEWSVPENSGPSSRQFTVTISAKRANSDGYAYCYVSGVQPSVNNVGYIWFEYDTVRASATTLNGSMNFTTEQVSSITSAITSAYWLHSTFIDVQSGRTEEEFDGQLDYTIDANDYNEQRFGTITLFGTSLVDGSLVQSTLHFYQAANEYGGYQQGFIYGQPPTIYMEHPEAGTNHFELAYTNVVESSVTVNSVNGNISGSPVFSAAKTILTFNVKNATSTTEYTMSQIYVGAKDTSGRTIPPIVLTVLQPPYVEFVEFPIWKDTDLVIPSESEYLLYKIVVNNDIIYAGRAFARDGEVTIRLNEIMAQVLKPEINLLQEGLQDNNAYANAVLYISLDGVDYQKYKEVKAYADWSYREQDSSILSNPIRKEVDRRQKFLNTVIDRAGNGPTVIVTTFDSSGNTNDIIYSLQNNIGTVVQSVNGADEITVSAGEAEMTYKVVDSCNRYCLYYLNSVGGWDSLIFNKTSKEKDNFERKTYKRNIDNNYPMHQSVEYRTKVKKEWTLNTGFLTDSQSINFAQNVVGTPNAYLHDLQENEIYPVLINTNNVDYQTFIRNGRKFCKYTLNVQLAQDRFRA